ncbi:flagellar biosynthesis protein FlhF [Aquabacterium sp. OR-4]|uniref:flagellar biosynthesis protein FlhF n=1 Tax=Aquabacterium sp. OR-4 TaxID=2978127 RepID=UPI0021B23602|nr:flagellar biosynthesis protein FlhF [Aquabacterium sp. OR-4]MDT7836536.1 flagellar biosynthesis protein FlhF [Aquabacterium sp. OR-4]
MNIRRFVAKTSREALAQVREQLGDDAVVLSTRPAAGGVEVLAMAPDGMQQIESAAGRAPLSPARSAAPGHPRSAAPADPRTAAPGQAERRPSLAERIAARADRLEPKIEMPAGAAPFDAPAATGVDEDVQRLGMSTLSFQDYVRERMLRRRQGELEREAGHSGQTLAASLAASRSAAHPAAASRAPAELAEPAQGNGLRMVGSTTRRAAPESMPDLAPPRARRPAPLLHDDLPMHDEPPAPIRPARGVRAAAPLSLAGQDETLAELRSVRSLIEERFGMLAFMEKLQRNPKQVALAQRLFDTGLSPGLVRKLVQQLPAGTEDDLAWAAEVLERNLITDEGLPAIEDHEGVLALIGPTGVGKTTSTAKIAAAFATRYGAHNLGLITLDAYRVAAHEQLRTYGRILGVPVHTAHDRASLEDLLELLQSKRLVLIDTAGMAQRDSRTRELLDMLSHPGIRKLLVLNAAAQGETVEDVMVGYDVARCHGVVLSKLDEAVKLGPALDALIRHKARVVGVANGQRVPEDWHRLSAQALVQRALRVSGGATWRLDADDVSLLFAATPGGHAAAGAGLHA